MQATDLTAKRKQAERRKRKDAVLDAWNRIFPGEKQAQQAGRPQMLDTDAEIRRKAKSRL